MCKLCAEQPKAGKSAYDKECRKKVEACRRNQKNNKESLEWFAELEKNPDPTRLRIVVQDSENQLNPEGTATRGKVRNGNFDILSYKEMWESSTIADAGEKLVEMNEFSFMKFHTTEKGKTPAETAALWDQMLANPKVEKGKDENGGPTVDVMVEKFKIAMNRKLKGNVAEGRLKDKRNPKAEDVAALLGSLDARQPDFDDDFFTPLLGNLGHAAGSSARSSFTGASDVMMSAAAAKKKQSKPVAVDDDNGGEHPEEEHPDAKRAKIDIASKTNTLAAQWHDVAVGLKTKAKAADDLIESTVKEFSAEELREIDYASFYETIMVRKAGLAVITGDDQELNQTLRVLLGKAVDSTDVDDETKAEMTKASESDQTIKPSTLVNILRTFKKAVPCTGFNECPTLSEVEWSAAHCGDGCETKEP
jgi:hypothetical protein